MTRPPPGFSVFAAHAQTSSSARSATPGVASVMRSWLSCEVISVQPPFTGPIVFATGTRTSS